MRTPARPRHLVVVRYHLPNGSRCTRDTPGAVRTSETTDTYYATLKINGRRRTVSLKTAEEGAAWAELRRLQRREHERAAGITDDRLEQAARPLDDHLADWEAALRDKGTSADQVKLLLSRVRKLAALAGWGRATDLSEDSCLKALAVLQADTDKGRGRGAQTRNHYASAAKQFARWCSRRAKPRRLHDDPLSGVQMVSVEADRRHDRRCPTDEEVGKLFAWLHDPAAKTRKGRLTAPVRSGMPGPTRALGYKLAMATGFRAGELRSLTRQSFDLDAATVTVRAGYSKNRRKDVHPLPAWLAEQLRVHFAAGGGCWAVASKDTWGDILQRDLADAGVAYRVETPDGPLFLDMHSFRSWYITMLASDPGVTVKTLMTLARHSTPMLSLKIYAKARQQDMTGATGRLPEPGKRPEAKPKPKGKRPAKGTTVASRLRAPAGGPRTTANGRERLAR